MESERVAGRYAVLRAVGHGGMGTVWLCNDELLGRQVALKQIGGLPGEPAVETRRAMREARAAAALNHPNVVSVYDVVNHAGRPWLVMEYVEGSTLGEVLQTQGPLSPQRAAEVGSALADALAAAHERGIVHRDVKPGNVLVDRTGRPKISDFGIARAHGDEQLTVSGYLTGTPAYLSPELARGGDPDGASDVWALGATLYVAVEGRPPYEPRGNPIALLQDIASRPPRPLRLAGPLAPAIGAMMHPDPATRWSMEQASRRLGRLARAEAGAARVAGPGETELLPVGSPPASTRRLPQEQPGQGSPHDLGPPAPEPPRSAPVEPPRSAPGGPASTAAEEPPRSAPDEPPPSAPEERDSSGRRWLPAALLALLVLLGGGYLASRLGADAGRRAAEHGTSSTRSSPATASGTSTPARQRTAPSRAAGSVSPPAATTATPPAAIAATRPPATTASPPAAITATAPATASATAPATATATRPATTTASRPPTSSSAPPASGPPTDGQLAAFVRSYFRDVTTSTDLTWGELTPAMQAFAGGRSGYDTFWHGIASVTVDALTVDASTGTAVATFTYTKADGTTSRENHRLTFVYRGGRYLINSDQPAG